MSSSNSVKRACGTAIPSPDVLYTFNIRGAKIKNKGSSNIKLQHVEQSIRSYFHLIGALLFYLLSQLYERTNVII